MTSPAVKVHEVTKVFRPDRGLWRRLRGAPGTTKRAALDHVSLTIGRGEIFGLIGANGAGKTTLLKILSTALLPEQGAVEVDGIDALASAAQVRTRLAVVPADERALFWRVSARENVRLFASLYGLAGAARDLAVDRVLELVGLAHVGHQQVGSFSSGMRQRTLIARALVSQPRILVLDEPTRSLDPVTARELRLFIRDVLCTSLGTTIVLATHSTEEAEALCDRAAVLVRGRVIAMDTLPRLRAEAGGARFRIRVHAADADRARVVLQLPSTDGTLADDGTLVFETSVTDTIGVPSTIEALVRDGVRVTEFAPVPLALADLLDAAATRASATDDVMHA